jgi:hypothetical protein
MHSWESQSQGHKSWDVTASGCEFAPGEHINAAEDHGLILRSS